MEERKNGEGCWRMHECLVVVEGLFVVVEGLFVAVEGLMELLS